LNTALARATVMAQVQATHGILVLPADLPLLTADDVRALIDRAAKPPVVVIAPDRHGKGTNALLMVPPGQIEYDFGEGSFQKHCDRATKSGARLEIVNLPSLGLDLDVPEDLELIRKMEASRT
jgi:2-phospho-L-lactate guanylyltransferase